VTDGKTFNKDLIMFFDLTKIKEHNKKHFALKKKLKRAFKFCLIYRSFFW